MNRNYQKELEKIIEKNKAENKVPSLFLHSCCAPCSSYVLEYLSQYFEITDFFYNPNISPKEEYEKRTEEMKRLIEEMPFVHKPKFVEGEWRTCRRAESDAFSVSVCVWRKRHVWQQKAGMIISQQR